MRDLFNYLICGLGYVFPLGLALLNGLFLLQYLTVLAFPLMTRCHAAEELLGWLGS